MQASISRDFNWREAKHSDRAGDKDILADGTVLAPHYPLSPRRRVVSLVVSDESGQEIKAFCAFAQVGSKPSQPASAKNGRYEKPPGKSSGAQGKGETVLVIEDDASVRMLITEVLHELGYAAIEVGDSRGALPILRSDARLDLIISGVGLPGMDGKKLAEIARQYRPDIRVLFVTGYAEHAKVRDEFLGKGMDMISKPFSLDTLGHKVREMLSEKRPVRS